MPRPGRSASRCLDVLLVLSTFLLVFARGASAQLSPSATWATHAANNYQIAPNIWAATSR